MKVSVLVTKKHGEVDLVTAVFLHPEANSPHIILTKQRNENKMWRWSAIYIVDDIEVECPIEMGESVTAHVGLAFHSRDVFLHMLSTAIQWGREWDSPGWEAPKRSREMEI